MINLLSSIITSQHVSLLVAVGYIIYRILCGVMTCILLKAKGYSGIAFFLGLFGGVAAILFAIGMPDRNKQQRISENSCSYNIKPISAVPQHLIPKIFVIIARNKGITLSTVRLFPAKNQKKIRDKNNCPRTFFCSIYRYFIFSYFRILCRRVRQNL